MNSDIKSILLIDDDQDDQFFFATALQQVNDSVDLIAACNGVEALEKLRISKPDLILLDLIMPRMNGLIFLKMVKRNRQLAKIPVYIYTTDLSIFNEAEVVKAGAERIIYKAENLEETIKNISAILNSQPYRASA